jgi:hypothetical protein
MAFLGKDTIRFGVVGSAAFDPCFARARRRMESVRCPSRVDERCHALRLVRASLLDLPHGPSPLAPPPGIHLWDRPIHRAVDQLRGVLRADLRGRPLAHISGPGSCRRVLGRHGRILCAIEDDRIRRAQGDGAVSVRRSKRAAARCSASITRERVAHERVPSCPRNRVQLDPRPHTYMLSSYMLSLFNPQVHA